ncbi:MAG: helix-turn-helix domain-containing protein [Dehalococcoidia bacterium]|nr:helix-turn-helix domain-containing protein [Dehalococcoidia bacterium]
MEQISAAKKIKIIQLYLDSKSIREIASLTGVAVGTVANVINDLKRG